MLSYAKDTRLKIVSIQRYTHAMAYSTQSSDYWHSCPGRFDTLNQRFDVPLSDDGMPVLAPTTTVPSALVPYSSRRAREHAVAHNRSLVSHAGVSAGHSIMAIHYFLDDYAFENVWHTAERVLPRMIDVGAALTPDYSLWWDMPEPLARFQTYRNRWCGAYWQSHGVDVIPTVTWSTAASFEYAYAGIPADGTVAVSALGVRPSDSAGFTAGMRELVTRCTPSTILSYGPLRYCDDVDLPDVIEYPTTWDRRRTSLDSPCHRC